MLRNVSITLFSSCLLATAYDFNWVRAFTGNANNASSLALDAQTNAYLCGSFNGTVTFGTNQVASSNNALFVLKQDPQGQSLWFIRSTGDSASGNAIATAPDGSSYVVGNFTGITSVGLQSITNSNPGNEPAIFILKLNAAGQSQWLRSVPGGSGGNGAAIALAQNAARVWITGSTNGFLFLRGYDSNGNLIGHLGPASSGSVGRGIVLDTNGNFYVTGTFAGSLGLGTTNLSGPGSTAQFTARFTPEGTTVWAATVSDLRYAEGHAITLGPDGSVISAGRIDYPHFTLPYPTIFVMKQTSEGQPLWTQLVGAHRSVFSAEAVATDGAGNIYTAGSKMDPYTSPEPRSGPLVVLFTAGGSAIVQHRVTGLTPTDWGNYTGVAVDGAGVLHLAGSFQGTENFGTNRLTATDTPNGFAAQLAPLGPPRIIIARTASGARITWPGAATGFQLQNSGDMTSPVWSNNFNYVLVSNHFEATVNTNAPAQFYRLQTAP